MKEQYSIKDLEKLSGVKAHTLRIWEQRYSILKPKRSSTNIRFYTAEDLIRVLNISLLNNNGFKISKIADFSDSELIHHAQIILNSFTKESNQIDNLILNMVEINELNFEKIISDSILSFGFENTMEKIIFPFMYQVGNMWQMGLVNTIQEHFVSHLIRQKIIVNIDKINCEITDNSKLFLLYLPNREFHELSLLYCTFLIKSKGHKCLYLGQSVPLDDLGKVSKLTAPDFIVTSITSPIEESSLADYLKSISKIFKEKTILASGRLFFQTKEKIDFPNNIRLILSYEEFKNIIQNINFVPNE